MLVWAAIDERREALAATQERLRRSNAVLEREAEVQHEMWRLRSERELFVEIEKSLESKTRRIQMLLDSLPDSNDPDSIARRREMLVEVKLLVAYCKRKGALVLCSTKRRPICARSALNARRSCKPIRRCRLR